MAERPFISCIKVKGVHLLPPVFTETRRMELQRDKHQAVKLEKRLQHCRELKRNLQELLYMHSLTESPNFIGNSHIDDLDITSARSSLQLKRTPSLTKDTLDVAEYTRDGIRLINKYEDMVIESRQSQVEFGQGQQLYMNNCISDAYDTDSSLNKSSEITVSSVRSSSKDQFSGSPSIGLIRKGMSEDMSPSNTKSVTPSKPTRTPEMSKDAKSPSSPMKRLIRSNSYTLEAPSPILLAHLQKLNNGDSPSDQSSLSRTWTSLENNFIPLEDEFSSLNTVYNKDLTGKHISTEIHFDKLCDEEQCPQKDTEQKSPTIEVVQTDISVQQITVNANSDEIEPIKSTFHLSDPDCQLMQVLKKIPEDYSKQIIELIEKQRSEHYKKAENFGKQFNSSKNVHSTSQNEQKLIDNESFISELSNLSNYFSASDTLTPRSPVKLTEEAEREATIEQSPKYQQNANVSLGKSITDHDNIFLPIVNNENVLDNRMNIVKTAEKHDNTSIKNSIYSNVENCFENFDTRQEISLEKVEKRPGSSRKLFYSKFRDVEDIKKEWAANIICAYVKGYLTRRLLKTSRVQSLIDTIRDALMCALELHEVEQIDEADIELHRRLINQVSAACYAFHDIFFALSVPEKMAMISADRKRIIEKTQRPSSAPDHRRPMSNSSRSSTKSLLSHSQSVMKI